MLIINDPDKARTFALYFVIVIVLFAILIFFGLSCFGSAHAADSLKLVVNGTSYDLYIPTTYDKNKVCPLVVALHHSQGRGIDMIDRWKEAAEKKGYIVVAPDSRSKDYWQIPGETKPVLDVIADVKSKYSVDSRRIYIMGFSSGATFTYYLGAKYPDVFRAAVAFSGRYAKVEKDILGLGGARIPFLILNGKEDIRVEPALAEYAQKKLLKRGHEVKLMILSGIDHQYPADVTWHMVRWFEKYK